MTAETFDDALSLLELSPPTEARPVLLLVDVDTDLELTPPHYHRASPHKNSSGRNGGLEEPAVRLLQGNGQRHLRATSDSTTSKGLQQRNRRLQAKPATQNALGESLCGLDFLETILQGLAKGSLRHVIPVAMSSTTSQERIMELFNLGVADVLLKPIGEQVARTLFLNAHRYSKYKTAVTIPRYATQKNSLALPSHTRLRNVFLKDQWLSDILISHYCPTPSKMTLQDFPSMNTRAAQERIDELKGRLLSWDFHPHDLCEDDLMRCVVIVIQEVMKLDGLGDLNIPEHLLHRFVIGLRDSYHRSNPYHNFAHAVDVLQATFYFLCRMDKLPGTGIGSPPMPLTNGDIGDSAQGSENSESSANIPTQSISPVEGDNLSLLRIQDFLRPEDIFALVVASIGHDVGHPGVNNMFLVNAHTPLAQVYNDRSVLESFHSMALFQVMKKHGFECFDVDSQNRKFMEFRKMVVSTILATDMGLHFDYVGKIKEQTERLRLRNLPGGNEPRPNQASIDEQERLVLCGTLIKCADISNASRPFHVAERWSSVLLQEMCNQADIEKEMAVCSGAQSVPAGSTKSLANDRGMQIDSQLGFIHGFAMPLFSSVKEMIPEMGYCVDYLQINHAIWQDRKTEYLKNGGGPIFTTLSTAKVHSEDENQEQQIAPSPKNSINHSRAKSLNGRTGQSTHSGMRDGIKPGPRKAQHATGQSNDQQGLKSDVTAPFKLHSNNARRPAQNTANGSSGGNSDSSPGLSSIPRPRTRTKAATAEGSVILGNYGQSQSLSISQQRGNNGQQDGRSRQANGGARGPSSRVRTVTSATTLSVPVSELSQSQDKAGSRPVSPNAHTSSRSSSRGHRSPGRRSQGSNHDRGSQGHRTNSKPEKTALHAIGGVMGDSHLDKPEPIVLGSLLPVTAPVLAVVDADSPASCGVNISVSSSGNSP
ncbi:3',5'-cyclic-nucleotide phosphodiesterase [Entomortierella chlamydospora]|uniref:Phosphodiesterase n=1 Tax=Entomortierella chlamydospora TaxID=101097 RepID=A0A9P6SXN2_9FUNG|nr:3',5'-cyclic-nucleotide phosphodiesterase [Entomortierella chlamydospora]KAG0010048.1 3',5'-cyclic-nucleotide phosphodiesterase [Entomortierella chlamydospora]